MDQSNNTSTLSVGDYANLEQVAGYLLAFNLVYDELKAAGQFPYNSCFRGRIKGIEGPDEDAAIYMLQNLRRVRKEAARARELLALGFEWIDSLETTTKFRHVVLVPTRLMQGEWHEYKEARVVPNRDGYGDENMSNGSDLLAILPKGRRTNGYMITGRRVLALRYGKKPQTKKQGC